MQGRENGSSHAEAGEHVSFRLIGVASGNNAGGQVKRLRQQRGLTQSQVAARAKISVPTVRAVEAGTGLVISLQAVLAVLAPKAGATQPYLAHWQVKKDVRLTPPQLVAQIVEVFGRISIDPAADPNSFVEPDRTITEAEDGLVTGWSGRLAFVNPPYSDLTRWIGRCADAWERREVDTIIGLFPARTETTTFRQRVFGVADVLFLPRRLSFHDSDRKKLPPAPFALMICIWGAARADVQRFTDLTGSLIVWADTVHGE